jgi:hypothetical protein
MEATVICRVSIKWNEKYEDLSLESYNIMQQICCEKEVLEKPKYFYTKEALVDIEEACKVLLPLKFTIEIINFKNNTFIGVTERLQARYAENIPVPPPVGITHIHISNIGLLMIDEVQLMEDACTDSLQKELDIGWRILAVCPPNGTRRPDYILGRTKEK